MSDIKILRYKNQLDYLFAKVSSLGSDLEMQSHWSRYLCVRVSGFLEIAVKTIYKNYAKEKACPFVVNYVENQLSYFQNPRMDKILNIAKSFNPEWAEKIRLATEGEIKDAIETIGINRNKIAHGENVGITYVNIKKYYENVLKLIELLEKQCK